MKIFIETYGCQMNVADSELVSTILQDNKFQITKNVKEADVIIFNTCSVRQNAEDRVMGRISNEMSRKSKQNLKIGVIGCMAQRLQDKLHEMNKEIDFVVGVDQYKQIPEIIENLFEKNTTFQEATLVNNDEIYKDLYPHRGGELNAFVTIMRGCNNFCS